MRGLAYNPGILPAEMIIRQRVKPMPSREELLKRNSFSISESKQISECDVAEWEEMKQMSLIEMDGFLKGKCIPRDLLEVKLKLSEAAERAWESSMMQACGEDGPKSVADKFAELEAKCAALATDNEKAM